MAGGLSGYITATDALLSGASSADHRSLASLPVCCICKPARAWLMDNARILCTMTEPQLIFCFFGS